MISIQAGTTSIYSGGTGAASGTLSVNGQSATSQTSQTKQAGGQQPTATSEQGDTLSLSAQGTALASSMNTDVASADTASTETSEEEALANTLANAAADAGVSESSDETSSTDSSLSSYTETQLKEMLRNGEITQAEYNAEIQSREQEAEAADDSDASQVEQMLSIDVEV
jgi:hypothetical protein